MVAGSNPACITKQRKKEMKRKIKVPKERNPFVAHVATKRSGAHGKTNKALRRAEKIKLMDR
jgi:hypothetical protein